MADAEKKSKLQSRLEQPPENWVDVVVIAVVKDPVLYGCLALVVFLILSLVSLWAARELIRSIDKDERKAKRHEALQRAHDGQGSGVDSKKSQ